jgi:hypothetical protein
LILDLGLPFLILARFPLFVVRSIHKDAR